VLLIFYPLIIRLDLLRIFLIARRIPLSPPLYRQGTRNLIVITRSGIETEEEEEKKEEEEKEEEKEEEEESKLGSEGARERRLERKKKRVASLHRCRFRALPLEAHLLLVPRT